MLVTLAGIEYLVSVLPNGYWINVVASLLKRTPSIEVKFWLPASTVIEVSLVAPENA
jgi:hypothetical protein